MLVLRTERSSWGSRLGYKARCVPNAAAFTRMIGYSPHLPLPDYLPTKTDVWENTFSKNCSKNILLCRAVGRQERHRPSSGWFGQREGIAPGTEAEAVPGAAMSRVATLRKPSKNKTGLMPINDTIKRSAPAVERVLVVNIWDQR